MTCSWLAEGEYPSFVQIGLGCCPVLLVGLSGNGLLRFCCSVPEVCLLARVLLVLLHCRPALWLEVLMQPATFQYFHLPCPFGFIKREIRLEFGVKCEGDAILLSGITSQSHVGKLLGTLHKS